MDFARRLMEERQYEGAAAELERFLFFFPDDPKVPLARYLIGRCLLERGRYEQAREVFLEVERTYEGRPITRKARLAVAEAYFRQGVYDEAAHHYLMLVENPPDPETQEMARMGLGWSRLGAARWKEASEAFAGAEPGSPFFEDARRLSEESLKGEDLPEKSPAAAGVMAGVLPGLGHAYVGRYKDGAVAFLVNALFIWATIEAFHEDHEVLGGILAFVELGWYTGNIYSAVNAAHKHNRKVRRDFMEGLKEDLRVHPFGTSEGVTGLALTIRF
jgi:tetratricopeptide (TPR) repeat protein